MIKHDLKVLRTLVNTQEQPLANKHTGLVLGKLPAAALSNLLDEHGREGSYILFLQDEITAALLVLRFGWEVQVWLTYLQFEKMLVEHRSVSAPSSRDHPHSHQRSGSQSAFASCSL